MSAPLEIPSDLEVRRTVSVTTRVVPRTPVRAGAEVFEPSPPQRRFLAHLLSMPAAEQDLEAAARATALTVQLREWRLQPGFVKWVETYFDATSRLEMAVLRRRLLAVAMAELTDPDPEVKPRALPLVAKLWPAARLGKQGDDAVRVSVSATELFRQLEAGAPPPAEEPVPELPAGEVEE